MAGLYLVTELFDTRIKNGICIGLPLGHKISFNPNIILYYKFIKIKLQTCYKPILLYNYLRNGQKTGILCRVLSSRAIMIVI